MKIKPYDYAPVGERVKNARVMRELTQEKETIHQRKSACSLRSPAAPKGARPR